MIRNFAWLMSFLAFFLLFFWFHTKLKMTLRAQNTRSFKIFYKFHINYDHLFSLELNWLDIEGQSFNLVFISFIIL